MGILVFAVSKINKHHKVKSKFICLNVWIRGGGVGWEGGMGVAGVLF